MPFETLFQHHPQPMVLFGSETLRIYAANDAAWLHYGYSGERFVTLKATDLWHEDDRERFARVLPQLAFARPVGPTRWRHRHSSGVGFDVELHATSIVVGPEPAWLIIAASVPTKVDGGERNLKVAALEASFIAAVDRGAIDVAYQPFVAADDGRIVGFEALARWTDPEHGAISPDTFVPLAEATGSIVTMGRSIMERACGRLRRAIDRTGSELFVSVNVSVRQLAEPGFAEEVTEILSEADLSARNLVIEMTESAYVGGAGPAARNLQALAERRVRLAIDDFGTGYSALGYLKRLPVEIIKIDRSFVADIASDPTDLAITRAIAAVAAQLGLDVIGEGVETREQARLLRALGCRYLQGHLFSPPLDSEALDDRLAVDAQPSRVRRGSKRT